MTKWFMSLILMVGLICIAVTGYAAPVEYVKICTLYGAGFYYLPGTDICFNPTTGETRQQTVGGTWVSIALSNPGVWVVNPQSECLLGRLVKVGTFNSSSFTINSHGKYETAPFPLTLRTGEFIAKVMMSGGFDVTGTSTFCLSYFDASTGAYSTLGCQNTAMLMDQPATFSFTVPRSVPPPGFTKPFSLVGNNGIDNWGAPDVNGAPPPFDGSLSCWVCIQNQNQKAPRY